MQQLQWDTVEEAHETIGRNCEPRLNSIARQSVAVWFDRDGLDRLLASYIDVIDDCELLYAFDRNGRQVSSNIETDAVDLSGYGQDLSSRPYAISVRVTQKRPEHGAYACRRYTSQATFRPCVTVLYPVTVGSSLLGYIAADVRVAGDRPPANRSDRLPLAAY